MVKATIKETSKGCTNSSLFCNMYSRFVSKSKIGIKKTACHF